MPLRGETYWITPDSPPGMELGPESRARHAVIVIQNNYFNRVLNTVLVVPTTTSHRAANLPTSVHIPAGEGQLRECYAICHQVRVLDFRRLRQQFRIGQVSEDTVARIAAIVATLINPEVR